MRLIDADAVDIEYRGGFHDDYVVNYNSFINAPTIDAVEVVRCKDCKWCLVEDGGCERIGMVLFADEIENHFCGYGEVRDE